MRPPRVRVTRWCLVAVGVLALVLLGVALLPGPYGGTTGGPAVAPRPSATPPQSTSAGPATPAPGRPVALRIPALDVDARVVPVGLRADGVLVPPADPRVVGWWSGGARPGSRRGAAVLTGHTVHTGGGVLDHLAVLGVGDVVRVATGTRVLAFDVVRVRELDRDRLAAAAPRLFDPSGPPCLVLVTCTGWDGTGYRGNTVVVARVR